MNSVKMDGGNDSFNETTLSRAVQAALEPLCVRLVEYAKTRIDEGYNWNDIHLCILASSTETAAALEKHFSEVKLPRRQASGGTAEPPQK